MDSLGGVRMKDFTKHMSKIKKSQLLTEVEDHLSLCSAQYHIIIPITSHIFTQPDVSFSGLHHKSPPAITFVHIEKFANTERQTMVEEWIIMNT